MAEQPRPDLAGPRRRDLGAAAALLALAGGIAPPARAQRVTCELPPGPEASDRAAHDRAAATLRGYAAAMRREAGGAYAPRPWAPAP